MNTAVYIGAGIDIVPVLLFPNITKFIYIDSQPLTEFGVYIKNDDRDHLWINDEIQYFTNTEQHLESVIDPDKLDENGYLYNGRPLFLKKLFCVMKNIQFDIINHKTNKYYIFSNGKQEIKYYYSCPFPLCITNDELKNDLQLCNTIILCGYSPDIVILDYVKQYPYIICDYKTYYKYDSENLSNCLINLLINEYLRREYLHPISKYFLINFIGPTNWNYWEPENINLNITQYFNILNCDTIGDIQHILYSKW